MDFKSQSSCSEETFIHQMSACFVNRDLLTLFYVHICVSEFMWDMNTKVPWELRRGHQILRTGVTESFDLWVLRNEPRTSARAASTKH